MGVKTNLNYSQSSGEREVYASATDPKTCLRPVKTHSGDLIVCVTHGK